MDNAKFGILHVSQNIPTRSNLDVSMKRPSSVQVHVSAVGPRFSSLSWTLEGDPENNEIDVGQKTPDHHSELSCQPKCVEKVLSMKKKKDKKGKALPRKRTKGKNRNVRRKSIGKRRLNRANKRG